MSGLISRDRALFLIAEEENLLGGKTPMVSVASPTIAKMANISDLVAWYSNEHPKLKLDTINSELFYEQCPVCAQLARDIKQLEKKDTAIATEDSAEKPAVEDEDSAEKPAAEAAMTTERDEVLRNLLPGWSAYLIPYLSWSTAKPVEQEVNIQTLPPTGRFIRLLNNQTNKKHGKTPRESFALEEVDQAVKKLEEDEALGNITLKPQNSFIRRTQHQRARALGCISTSVGEADARAVQLEKKKPSKANDDAPASPA